MDSTPSIDVSLIITVFNNRSLLRQLLRGIKRFPPHVAYEIFVVDNHSSDLVSEMVTQEFPEVKLFVLPKNYGLAYANNLGMRNAHGRYVLILNPDIAVLEGSIDALVAFADAHPHAGIVGPRLLNPDKSLQFSTYRFPKWYTPILRRTPLGKLKLFQNELRSYVMKDWDHADDRPVDWVLGAAMLIRASTLAKVGMQDEHFFLYFEDVDLCKRFWNNAIEVWYAHKVPFIHYHRRESAESPGFQGIITPATKYHIQSWIKYFRKHRK